MKAIILIFNMLVILADVGHAFAQQQEDTILHRYERYLFATETVNPAQVNHWVRTVDAEGQWPDINYQDKSRANWQVWDHLKRLDALSLAWSKPSSPLFHDTKVWHAIQLALNNWLKNKYQNPNWWHNEIGVPQGMRDLIVLLRDTLSAHQLDEALQVMAQFRLQDPGAGANLTWSADLGLHYGALVHDTALIDRCRRLIVDEVHISTGDGIQPDYSFHQHGNRLQMYQYGKAFLMANVRIAWELRDTRWAFPESKMSLLTDLLLKGWQWMARGIYTVPGTMDRSVSRKGGLNSPDIRYLIPFLCELNPEKAEAFKTLAAHQNGNGALQGFRYYPYSDFAAYQNDKFSFFLKTISMRTLPSEVGLNSENLKGRLLNSGDAYLIRNGKEYYDLMPVWDWEKLPGITAWKNAYKIVRKPFTGSVSDGNSGLTAMDYAMKNKEGDQRVTAHKIWVCHNDMIVCLIGDLTISHVPDPVYTVLDQSRLQGKVIVNRENNTIREGNQRLKNVKWIWHHGFAVIPIEPASMQIQTGEVTGTWSSINASLSRSLITDSVFMPVMLHDTNRSTGYVLAYGKSAKNAKQLCRKQKWEIVRNDKDCQAVKFKDGTVMAAFFSAGQLKMKKHTLQTDKPCLIMFSNHLLYLSDPLHQGGILNIQFDHKAIQTEMATDGTTKEIELK